MVSSRLDLLYSDGNVSGSIWIEKVSKMSPRLRALIASYDQQIQQISARRQSEQGEPIPIIHEEGGDHQDSPELKYREYLLACVSHEFRAYLAVIRNANLILQAHYDRLTPEQRAEQFEKINQQITRMTDVLEDVLTVTRIRQDTAHFRPEGLDVALHCLNLIERARVADSDQHRLEIQMQGRFEGARMDEGLLETIVLNLLSNAFKYSLPGATVAFSLKRDGNDISIRVSDQGIGIPAEDLPRLFTPFFRGSNAKRYPGTGLGLVIVKESVEKHNGTITCESQPGIGTTFTVRLPGGFE